MCRKLICLVCFVFVLGLFLTSAAQAELMGWWKLDEGSGNVAYDSSGNGRDGTLNGDPQWVAGWLGGALDFDGDDHVDTGYTDDLANWTIAAWVKSPAAPSGDAPSGPVHKENNYQFNWNHGDATFRGAAAINVGGTWHAAKYEPLEADTWYHLAATFDGENLIAYRDGVLITDNSAPSGTPNADTNTLKLGRHASAAQFFTGIVDDARVYDEALTEADIKSIMIGTGIPIATSPIPADGAIHADTWVTLSWRPGDFAVSHDVYMGENFDDVNNGTGDTSRGNQTDVFFVAGFPGFPYPDGLVNGTTYYWRIDEVNDADPNSPWKGDVWSFTVPPKTAYSPDPAEGAEFVDLNVQLTWTAGFGAKLHYIVFGEDFDEVSNAAMGVPAGTANYNPGPLNLAKTYYWRVDEFDGGATHKGEVWSFTTLGAVSGPNPADGAVDVKPSVVLSWDAGAVAASHEVYFGADADAVKNATTTSPEYKGPKALGEESYDPGKLVMNTAYYWRIDEVNGVNPDSPWAGNVWSFTTGDFFVIDDFEIYDANDNQIWAFWHDGLGFGAPGTPDFFGGNGTGAAVGDETTNSYTEETIVNGGSQSMPISYDNNKQGFSKYSEVELTLTDQRDWTEEGVTDLSLWFRGNPASVGSFVEGPTGTYTMTGSGADIWDVGPGAGEYHDEFHYAFKTLSGTGSIVARVESVDDTNAWAKAGVMIRESLNADSKHAMMVVSASSGVSFQRRPETAGASASDNDPGGITAPYWIKIERDLAGNFSAYSSANGSTWQKLGVAEPIQMGTNVYIGLAVTSHDAALTCQAVFSNVTTTGSVGSQWTNQDIGIASNDAEPLYVAVSNSAGAPAVVVHDDPAAAQIDTWTEWVIPMQSLTDQGITLTNVDKIAIGLGSKGNMTIPGGAGKMYIDDIRLLKPAPEPEPQP
ncbi:MAG: LamG domain-containing protein [Sedimentisphaerales bacterium]